MKILVTGGAGYVGSVVAAMLVDSGHSVTVLDDLSTGHRDAVPAGAVLAEAEVSAAARVLDSSYDAVMHFAARSLVSESTRHPEAYWRTNVCGALALLEAVRAHGVSRVVFSSTAAVYGEPATVPIPETEPAVATNPYGASKLAADQMLDSWCHAYELGGVSLRYFNVAGAHAGHGERHDPETHLVPTLLRVAAGHTQHAWISGTDYPTRDGSAVRDYLHVVDLAAAHLRALEHITPGACRVYNLGTGNGHTVLEVLQAVRSVTGHPVPAVRGPRRPGDPAVLVAAHERAREELGWQPQASLEDMISGAWAFESQRKATT